MKKFNVKVLSMAVTAAVASGAAGAAEQNFAAAVGGKDDQGQAAFFTVFGEGTTYDKDTGKLTFKKDNDALLLKTLELEQTINGFASGSDFITTDAKGNKTVRKATNEDIEADSLKGVGLAGRLTAVNTRVDNLEKDVDDALDALDDQDETIEELKTAITTNGTRIVEVATGVNKLNESVTDMGKEISDQFDAIGEDVTAVNTRVDTLEQDTADAKAAAKAAEDKVTELSANVDSKVKEAKDAADKAVDAASKIDAVADKADKASKGVEILAKAAMEALEVNRQDIDANKAAIETKADKSEVEAAQKAAAQAALATIENARELNGFKEGDQIVVAKDDGSKVIRTATKEDVENADFEGVGLKEVVTEHDEALFELAATVNDNSEALVKTAEVVNAISADVNANKALLEAQGEANKGFNNAIASLDKDIGDLALAGKAAADALEANRQDIDANKAAIAENTASLKEQEKANDGFNNAIASLDKDIGDLASAGKAAMEALEVNRKDIDANKKYIGDLALAGKAAADALEANRQDIDANKAAIA
ncbi:MAG: outer membrane insertion C- signal, partial [Neisseria sicca]|nr:outer membrane insertion C- signal [Neisseria sicca]